MTRRLFLPGAGASPLFWRPLGDLLPSDWDKRYLAWPGLGDEPPSEDVAGIDDLVRLTEAELGDEPCDLLAQSMGGLVAMLTALRNPERIRRLVLTATSGGIDMAAHGAAEWAHDYFQFHPNAAPWITTVRRDLTDRLPAIAAPTLLLWGDQDAISPFSVGEKLAAILPAAHLVVIPGGEHDLVASRAAACAPYVEAHLR